MIEFAWPWVFTLLLLPVAVRLTFAATDPTRGAALRVPALDRFDLSGDRRRTQRWFPMALAGVAWLLLVAAGARPQWVGEPVDLPRSGRDLMLAVDLSVSMDERDFDIQGQRVDRLTATKFVAQNFIERREGDRLGLILFGERAYLQTPLTFDRQTVSQLLGEAVIGLAGRRTAIGDAIGLAAKRLKDNAKGDRIVVLLTDGSNTAGELQPLRAAQVAADLGVKVYTIGVGAEEAFSRSNYGTRRYNFGAAIDEETLTEIAETTAGRYFRARDTRELESIYRLIDELEPVDQDVERFRPVKALFFWPLAGAVLLAALLAFARSMGRLP